jgi:hypothetical protein
VTVVIITIVPSGVFTLMGFLSTSGLRKLMGQAVDCRTLNVVPGSYQQLSDPQIPLNTPP